MATSNDQAALSPQLRAVIERLLASRDEIANEAVEAFQREIPAYRHITDEALWDEVRGNVEENAQLWFGSLLTGAVPSHEHLAKVAGFARNRVHQGVPLPELLQAFRIGSSILWSAVLAEVRLEPSIQEEVLFELSTRYFDFIETVSRTTTEAYTAELGTRTRWRDRIKHELVELVFSSRPGEGEFRQRAARRVASDDSSVERIGIGSPGRGADGWRVAADQALRALELGPQVQREQKLHRYADLAIYDVARRTPQIAQFLQTCLDRLPDDTDVLDSIASWFDHGRHLKAAAAAQRVHPNTLSYRLKRAEEILGGTFDDPEWSLRLQLALKLRQCR